MAVVFFSFQTLVYSYVCVHERLSGGGGRHGDTQSSMGGTRSITPVPAYSPLANGRQIRPPTPHNCTRYFSLFRHPSRYFNDIIRLAGSSS